MSDYTIDVDREAVLLDDVWYSAEELAAKVTEMLTQKDFRIGQAAQALEALQSSLADVRDIGFRLSAQMLDALERTAGQEGRTTSAILREALNTYLERTGAAPPMLSRVTQPGMPQPAEPGVQPQPAVAVEPVSDAEATDAVALTPKKKDDKEQGDVESGWFSGKQD